MFSNFGDSIVLVTSAAPTVVYSKLKQVGVLFKFELKSEFKI